MDQSVRNKLRNVVTQCRKLLEDATAQTLQGQLGIYASRKKGLLTIEDESSMAHLVDEDRSCRQDLIDHLSHIEALGYKPADALEQLIREISFTHLNRLCAYKMMEARDLMREAVSRGLKSQGFMFYLADHSEDEKLHNGGKQDEAYRHFLDWLGGTLSEEIGVLFNPNDPANRIYPPQRVLDEVLDRINNDELNGVWSQDETIGWVYQYFTPKELRDKARKESQAPRNSYELAFRNQFFTPRYVVEFLTDNTLGRIWHEMQKGETTLSERCRYLVRRPTEIFLKKGEEAPKEAKKTREGQEELLKEPVYIPHRPKKDPREIRVLDPASGSGHFLIYCFDLLQVIYEEAYEDPELGPVLKDDYASIEDLRREIPGLILRHNLHGIDIDLRATQIAALAMWLRCQRAYQEQGLKNGERPKITRSNFVCAEPMPGETDMLKEFTATLKPTVLGQLVGVVFDKMKLAGEAGSLLKIEDEIKDAIAAAKEQWKTGPKVEQEELFAIPKKPRVEQTQLFDVSDVSDERFWEQAEDRIFNALQEYAGQAENGHGFRRRLFSQDASRGFSFVDICRKKYDVVLMNPPFGLATAALTNGIRDSELAKAAGKNLAWAFVVRALSLVSPGSIVGCIIDRTIFQKSSYEQFRETIVFKNPLLTYADLGAGVLDANVFTSCFTMESSIESNTLSFITDLRRVTPDNRCEQLAAAVTSRKSLDDTIVYWRVIHDLKIVPFHSFAYWIHPETLTTVFSEKTISEFGMQVGGGLQCNDVFRFVRSHWEVDPICIKNQLWQGLYNGGDYSRFAVSLLQVVNWANSGSEIKAEIVKRGNSPSRHVVNEPLYGIPGIAGGERGEFFDVHCMPSKMIFSNEGRVFLNEDLDFCLFILGYLNTLFAQQLVNIYCGQHKGSDYLRRLPVPKGLLEHKTVVSREAAEIVTLKRSIESNDEVSRIFQCSGSCMTQMSRYGSIRSLLENYANHVARIRDQVQAHDNKITKCLNDSIGESVVLDIEDSAWVESPPPENDILSVSRNTKLLGSLHGICGGILSFVFGTVVGRWDIRIATDEHNPPVLPDLFAPLPFCSPGMLQSDTGLPINSVDNFPTNYPIRIDWDGILVDDAEHEDDVIRLMRNVLEVIWKEGAEAIEKEACGIMSVRELRDYFRKPGNGGFWMDHIKRYSKSRRKAPIYWYLRSNKGNYGLWLYYHRLDKDILFKALINYVEPKIRLEEDRMNALRGRKEAAGSSGREAKQLEKDIERQEQFVSELRDFADKLRRAANLRLDPDLNDGVVLNIAPLHELVPWKEAKKYWDELQDGKYEWSSIGKQLREKELVK